jgi:hypothetical protein
MAHPRIKITCEIVPQSQLLILFIRASRDTKTQVQFAKKPLGHSMHASSVSIWIDEWRLLGLLRVEAGGELDDKPRGDGEAEHEGPVPTRLR